MIIIKIRVLVLFTFVFSCSNLFAQIDSKKYFENSKLFTENKNYDKALIEIDNALKLDSLNKDYLLLKVKILYNKSDCSNAIVELQKIVLNEDKFDDVTVSYYSDLFDCIGESKKATETLLEYIKENKSEEIFIRLAQRYFKIKDYDKSIFYYRESIKLNPYDIDAIIDLTRILYAFKSSDEAINEVSKGLENNKNNIRLLTYLASCYHNNKDFNKAIEIENQIIKLEYKPEHIASRAMLYELQGKKAEAYEDHKIIIKLVKCNQEYFFKVLQYEFENRLYEKVIENSYKVITCDAKNESIVLDGLYTSLFFSGDFEKGSQYLDKRIASNPDNFNPYYIKSLLLLKNKQYENVLKNLELALKSKDADKENILRANLLKFGYYLLKEDYKGFVSYWKTGNVKSLDNKLNFAFVENSEKEKTEIKIDFNKNTGEVTSSIIIPTKVFRLLRDKYGLTINESK
jgi:tetratricopeptide (TPR) repeat protein|nr:tetratricopeptide repeat protein [uncultured Flavobacterium sp.]